MTPTRSPLCIPAVLARLAVVAVVAVAAQPRLTRADFPRAALTALDPSGGRAGAQVTVTLLGADLDDLERLVFSHPGISAVPAMTAPTEFDPQPKPIPRTMLVTIAPEVPPGLYDVVAMGRYGASNVRGFVVGTAEETKKTADIDTPAKALEIPADASVNARATAGKSDHYAVSMKAGERFRADVWARRIDSRMTPVLEVLDGTGRVVAAARRRHDDDPFLDFTAPADGRYVVRVHDLYAGGGDEVHYRLALSRAPQIDFVFPPVIRAGESVRLEVYGAGLPGGVPSGLPGLSANEGTAGLEKITIDARRRGRAERPGGGRAGRHAPRGDRRTLPSARRP